MSTMHRVRVVRVKVGRLFAAALLSATSLGTAAAATAAPSSSPSPVEVPLTGVLRLCDFDARTFEPTVGYGRGLAIVRSAGRTSTADVSLATARPDTAYNVRLIQSPRPNPAVCAVGDPGVAAATLNTDGVGNGATSVRGDLLPGTTGIWVFIDVPQEFSQTPAEHYTSDFMAPLRS